MNQTDLKFIYILGYAGHGKDTAKNILKEHYSNNTFCNLSFADTMKTQVSDILPQNVLGAVDGDTAFEKLNKLKDNHPEIEVFSGMNARKLLQVLGTEFYRSESLDPNIHVRFSAKRVLENLNSNVDENVVYASSDTRFPNELNFLLQASQCQTDKELDGFLKYYLNTCKEIDTKDNVLNHFKQVFNLSSLDDLACDLFDRIWVDVAGIKTTFDVENNYDLESSVLVAKELEKLDKEHADLETLEDAIQADIIRLSTVRCIPSQINRSITSICAHTSWSRRRVRFITNLDTTA